MQQLSLGFDGSELQCAPKSASSATNQSNEQARPLPKYRLIRARRRTLGITVHRGEVEVRAPLKAPQYWIDEFIQEKRDWINAQVTQQKVELTQIYRIVDGARLPLLGETVTVRVMLAVAPAAKRSRVTFDDNTLSFFIAASAQNTHPDNAAEIEKNATALFFRWIGKFAQHYMTAATSALASQIGLADRLCDVKYRRTSSKWGHCTSEGIIQYNPLIALAPMYVVDYIIAHEVCHLKHGNHSKSYWKLVDRVCQDRQKAEHWLKHQGYRLAME